MIIACPHCQTRYDVEEARFLPSGRSVRCSDCGTSFFVPAPQSVETLSPSTKLPPLRTQPPSRTQANYGEHHTRALQKDDMFPHNARGRGGLFKRRRDDQPEPDPRHYQTEAPQTPRWGPMSDPAVTDASLGKPRHQNRFDSIVDTDWEEVQGSRPANPDPSNYTRQERPQQRDREQRTERSNSFAQIDETSLHNDQTDVAGEVFAAINVQPRELERALKKVRRKAEARQKNMLTPLRVFGWMMLVSVFCALVYGGYHFRQQVVDTFPGAAKAYAVIGIDAKPFGLSLENINHRIGRSTTGPVLEISGELHNEGEKLIRTPLLQAEALDIRGELLASWTFSPEQSSVPSGSWTTFATRNPAPEGVVEVVLSFAPQKSTARSKATTKPENKPAQ